MELIAILHVCNSHWSCSCVSDLLIVGQNNLGQFCPYTWLSKNNCKWNTPFVLSHKPWSIPETSLTYILSQIAVFIVQWLSVSICINILIAILILTLNLLIIIINPPRLGKMTAISQRIFSDAFSWKKSLMFWLKLYWSVLLRVLSSITQHWVR